MHQRMTITSVSDINDVILFGQVKYKPEITENVTFVEVATQFFDRCVSLHERNISNEKLTSLPIEQKRANIQEKCARCDDKGGCGNAAASKRVEHRRRCFHSRFPKHGKRTQPRGKNATTVSHSAQKIDCLPEAGEFPQEPVKRIRLTIMEGIRCGSDNILCSTQDDIQKI